MIIRNRTTKILEVGEKSLPLHSNENIYEYARIKRFCFACSYRALKANRNGRVCIIAQCVEQPLLFVCEKEWGGKGYHTFQIVCRED